MKYSEIIVEHIVNAISAQTKEKYASAVWDILQTSYATIGGFKTAASAKELIKKSGIWKIITRNGEITVVGIYKDQFGRKLIAVGTNGTIVGKQDYRMLAHEDIKLERAWAEVSGSVEISMKRLGAKPIPSKLAKHLSGKEILDYNSDGYHYTRLIANQPYEKIMYGFVNLTTSDIDTITQQGIDVQSLPSNVKIS